jgi:hypothetical protein
MDVWPIGSFAHFSTVLCFFFLFIGRSSLYIININLFPILYVASILLFSVCYLTLTYLFAPFGIHFLFTLDDPQSSG